MSNKDASAFATFRKSVAITSNAVNRRIEGPKPHDISAALQYSGRKPRSFVKPQPPPPPTCEYPPLASIATRVGIQDGVCVYELTATTTTLTESLEIPPGYGLSIPVGKTLINSYSIFIGGILVNGGTLTCYFNYSDELLPGSLGNTGEFYNNGVLNIYEGVEISPETEKNTLAKSKRMNRRNIRERYKKSSSKNSMNLLLRKNITNNKRKNIRAAAPSEKRCEQEIVVQIPFANLGNFVNGGTINNESYIRNFSFLFEGDVFTGTFTNRGVFNNSNYFENETTFTNEIGGVCNNVLTDNVGEGATFNNGTYINRGTLNIDEECYFDNFNILNNSGTIQNDGNFFNTAVVLNRGTFNNTSDFDNNRALYIYSGGTFDNTGGFLNNSEDENPFISLGDTSCGEGTIIGYEGTTAIRCPNPSDLAAGSFLLTKATFVETISNIHIYTFTGSFYIEFGGASYEIPTGYQLNIEDLETETTQLRLGNDCLVNNGRLTIGNNCKLTIDGAGSLLNNGQITNDGTVSIGDDSVFDNKRATFTNNSLVYLYSGGILDNIGGILTNNGLIYNGTDGLCNSGTILGYDGTVLTGCEEDEIYEIIDFDYTGDGTTEITATLEGNSYTVRYIEYSIPSATDQPLAFKIRNLPPNISYDVSIESKEDAFNFQTNVSLLNVRGNTSGTRYGGGSFFGLENSSVIYNKSLELSSTNTNYGYLSPNASITGDLYICVYTIFIDPSISCNDGAGSLLNIATYSETVDNICIYTLSSNSVTSNGAVTIPEGYQLNISAEKTLTNNAVLTNNGTIISNGTIANNSTIDNYGIITNYKAFTNTDNPGASINNKNGGTIINRYDISNNGTITNNGLIDNNAEFYNYGGIITNNNIIKIHRTYEIPNTVATILSNRGGNTLNNTTSSSIIYVYGGGTLSNNVGGVVNYGAGRIVVGTLNNMFCGPDPGYTVNITTNKTEEGCPPS